MAKYELKNTTLNPARPIGLMVKAAGKGINVGAYRQINTDDIPVTLSEAEYNACKPAIDRYVEAKMLSVKVIGKPEEVSVVDEEESEPDAVEEIDELREEGKKLGIKSWHVMGADNLRAAIAEAKAEKED